MVKCGYIYRTNIIIIIIISHHPQDEACINARIAYAHESVKAVFMATDRPDTTSLPLAGS